MRTLFVKIVGLYFLTVGMSLHGQVECNSEFTDEDFNYIQQIQARNGLHPRNREPKTFGIIAYMTASESGGPLMTNSRLQFIIDDLNEAFEEIDVYFQLLREPVIIKDNTYHNHSTANTSKLLNEYHKEKAINLFFFNSIETSDFTAICGQATYPKNNRMFILMDYDCANNGSTLTHEFGHYFGLPHTHDRRDGRELVNGSNCLIAGDGFCDTPADPKLTSKVDGGCNYIGSEVDENNDRYQPDTRNYMSYSRKLCRIWFSKEQYGRMDEIAQNSFSRIEIKGEEVDLVISSNNQNFNNIAGTTIEVPFKIEDKSGKDLTIPLQIKYEIIGISSVKGTSETILLKESFSDVLTISIPGELNQGNYKLEARINSLEYNNEINVNDNATSWNINIDYRHLGEQRIFYNQEGNFIQLFKNNFNGRIANINVFNLSGQHLHQANLILGRGTLYKKIDLPILLKGIYIAVLSDEKEVVTTYKFYIH